MTMLFAVYVQAQGGGSALQLLLPFALIAVLYVVIFLPQQRRQKKWQSMLGQLKSGDKVVTNGGIHGVIFSLKDDTLVLRCPPDNLKLEVSRAAIASVITEDSTKS